MGPLKRSAPVLMFFILGALWLVSFRIADALTFFKTYSSIWFLPTGVTMAITMVAPGWLKCAPLVANLLLALPQVRAVVGVSVVNDYEPILHGTRLFVVYGGAGYALVRYFRIELPATTLRDYQWIMATTIIAVTIATVTGIGMHILAGNMTLPEAKEVALSWWLGDAIGAFAVPPLLVPLLVRLLGADSAEWRWPQLRSWLEQVGLILFFFFLSATFFHLSDGTVRVWHLLIVPPVLFALRGGLPMSATCVFLTIITVPLLGAFLSLQQELVGLSPLLLTTTIAGLLLGAAMSDRNRVLTNLENLVGARTKQLQDAHEFQRHLIQSIGHDLRQPIEGMKMVLEGLDRTSHSPAAHSAIAHARQIGAQASQLLSTILTYARFDAGTVVVQAQEFAVSRLFNNLALLFEPFAALRGVRLIWLHNDAVLTTDESLLGQALSNLIDNAIRLSEPGQAIEISAERLGDRVDFRVTDNVLTDGGRAGAAGFGLQIVARIAGVLDAQVVLEGNRRGISLPWSR